MYVLPALLSDTWKGTALLRAPRRVSHTNLIGVRKIQVRLMIRALRSGRIFKDWYMWDKALAFGMNYGMGHQSITRALNP